MLLRVALLAEKEVPAKQAPCEDPCDKMENVSRLRMEPDMSSKLIGALVSHKGLAGHRLFWAWQCSQDQSRGEGARRRGLGALGFNTAACCRRQGGGRVGLLKRDLMLHRDGERLRWRPLLRSGERLRPADSSVSSSPSSSDRSTCPSRCQGFSSTSDSVADSTSMISATGGSPSQSGTVSSYCSEEGGGV